jgi:transitional endoplasmic reticulum ATPase
MPTADTKNTKKSITAEETIRKFTNIQVQFVDDPTAKAIKLPSGMTFEEARYWLTKQEEEDSRTFAFEFKFTDWQSLDAMWATYRAAAELHGFVHVGDFNGWWGPTPPKMVTIEIGPGQTKQIPWGPIEIHGLSSTLTPRMTLVAGRPTLTFSATILNKERNVVDALFSKAVKLLKTSSIYKGKAITMDFTVVDPNNFQFDPEKAPRFMAVDDPQIADLVLPVSVRRLVEVTIWTPLRKTAEARKHKIPLRRTVTLAGKHGVGKSLTALATAKIATENGWTFLYLRNLKQLNDALHFASNHQPCVVFAEDIDEITSGERDAELNEILNTVDGIGRKSQEVMLVFTTNHIENIHQGMLRPGRTDTIIPFTPPDAEAVEKLLRLYGRDLIDPDADLTGVAEKLAGQIPAIIREVAEHSKLAAIADAEGDGPLIVRAHHLDVAADQMLTHAELLADPDEERPDMEVFGEALGNAILSGFRFQGIDSSAPRDKAQAREGLREILEKSGLQNGNGHQTDAG